MGERLRAIVAAATPRPIVAAATRRTGWVPDRIGESAAGVAPPVPDRSSPQASVPDSAQPPESPSTSFSSIDVSEHETKGAPSAPGRHCGSPGSRRLRWEPGRPSALALCLVAVISALLATGLSWWSRPTPSTVDAVSTGGLPVAAALSREVVPTEGGQQGGPTPGSELDADPGGALVVSVIGQVRQPGLVSVTSGARVADAIAAAGGALPEADLSSINLARLVVDGEQIAVGIPGSALPGGGDPAESGGLVNLNTATQAELEELPGIGPVLAQRIVDFRVDNGGFTAVEQLREVSGIGPTVYEDIVDLVTV